MESAQAAYSPVIMSVPAGAGRADADADVAVRRTGVAVGHVAGALNVPGEGVADAAVGPHRGIERVDCRPWQAERLGGALLCQDGDGCVNSAHLRHGVLLESLVGVLREPPS